MPDAPVIVLNRIWVFFVLVGFGAALVHTVQGDVDIFSRLLAALFDTAKTGFDIALGLVGVMSLWLGVMKIGEKGGLSVYGLGRFPVTLYKEQWIRLLDMSDEIREYIKANGDRMKSKE